MLSRLHAMVRLNRPFYPKRCSIAGGSRCGIGASRGGSSSGGGTGDGGVSFISGPLSGGSGGMSDGTPGECALSFTRAMTMKFSFGWDD